MNLANNLKRIRKENNISQEQLAEQLGVSRQSVSKWESGSAYPEMDKLLQIAKMYNINIDDLLNQDIKEINNEKQSKLALNKSIDDFLAFISKTIDMFCSMKFKDKFKCIFEQLIIAGILTIIFLIIGTIGNSILSKLLSFLPWNINYVIFSIFESIYLICVLVLGVILLIHIFKTRYLDYYEVVRENIEEQIITKFDEVEEKNNKIYLEKKKEKIVIRDPKHSEYKFITSVLKCLLFVIKFLALFIALAFCITLIAFVFTLITSFLIAKTGLLFIGILSLLISFISVNLIILIILFNFIMNRKSKKKLLFISFLVSLILCGIGCGFATVGVTEFNYINELTEVVFVTDNIIIPMEEELIIDEELYCYSSCNEIKYIEDDRDDIRIQYKHTKFFDLYQFKRKNYLYLDITNSSDNFFAFFRDVVKDINNKKIINYSNFEITIYTSKKNIETLKDNQIEYFNYQDAQDSYINDLEKKIYELEEKLNEINNNDL